MNPPIRLLISARDPGAANHLLPVIQYLGKHHGFDIRVVAAPPADRFFRLAGINFELVAELEDALSDKVGQLLTLHRPDAILTGLSGPDNGLDEVLLGAATQIPSFSYQDFWGDVNLGQGRAADCYLVRDDYAARLTEQRYGVSALVVGSTTGQSPAVFKNPRRRQSRSFDQVAWCGQPLWGVAGYAETFRTFARYFRHATILVKPHPKESARQCLNYRRLAAGRNPVLWRDSLERLFERCGLIASAFSNCALEQAAFNARPGTKPSIPVQLLFDRRLKTTYQEWTGIDRLPLADQGLSLGVTSRAMLKAQLSEPRLQRFGEHSKRRAKQLPRVEDAPRRIAETIIARIHAPGVQALRRA